MVYSYDDKTRTLKYGACILKKDDSFTVFTKQIKRDHRSTANSRYEKFPVVTDVKNPDQELQERLPSIIREAMIDKGCSTRHPTGTPCSPTEM